jgi:hypothetical protein
MPAMLPWMMLLTMVCPPWVPEKPGFVQMAAPSAVKGGS